MVALAQRPDDAAEIALEAWRCLAVGGGPARRLGALDLGAAAWLPALPICRFTSHHHTRAESYKPRSQPGIQAVPASGSRAIAAASIVNATRSSRSRLWTLDLPQ